MKEGKPVIFLCGHQANWEILFLEATRRMPGAAIGRPIKNRLLYSWILSIREKYDGKIFEPKEAFKMGFKALKQGRFVGIVGDQGMPDSGYCSPFFGKNAWTSPLPALLSYRTGSPLMVATTRRVNNHYITNYSDPIWPDQNAPMQQEIDRMMREALLLLEMSIKEHPEQWLWSHNRWKQQTLKTIKSRYRHDCLCFILPSDRSAFDKVKALLPTIREIYPLEFITIKVPTAFAGEVTLENAEIEPYDQLQDACTKDYRFKLVFNFTQHSDIGKHYKKLAAFDVVTINDLIFLEKKIFP